MSGPESFGAGGTSASEVPPLVVNPAGSVVADATVIDVTTIESISVARKRLPAPAGSSRMGTCSGVVIVISFIPGVRVGYAALRSAFLHRCASRRREGRRDCRPSP